MKFINTIVLGLFAGCGTKIPELVTQEKMLPLVYDTNPTLRRVLHLIFLFRRNL